MNSQIAHELIFSLIAFLVVFVVLYGPWQTLMTEYARQRLFEIRDSIFDLAADGKMSFDDPGYQEIRTRFNMLIRFCHYATWTRMLVFAVASRGHKEEIIPMYRLVKDKHLQKIIKRKEFESILVLVATSFVRSPVLMMLSPILLLLFVILIVFSGTNRNNFSKKAVILGKNIEKDAILHHG